MDLIRFVKFGLVGCSGIIVDFSITWLCKEKLKFNKYISNSLGFMFAVTGNYFLNKYFTFHDTNSHLASQFFTFLIVSLIGFLLNNLFLFLFQKYTQFNFYVSKAFVTLVVMFWNYGANSFFTFK